MKRGGCLVLTNEITVLNATEVKSTQNTTSVIFKIITATEIPFDHVNF